MLNKKFYDTIKQKLLTEKEERIQNLTKKIEIDDDGDEIDEIQANIQIELLRKFAALNKEKLQLIEEALARIDNKSYGLCVDCSDQISEKRLLLNPYYVVCISCAEEREILALKKKG